MRSARTSAVSGIGIPSPATPTTSTQSAAATGTGTRTPQRPSTAARTPSRTAPAASSEQRIKLAEGREIRIIANDATNALIILATAADYRMIEAALKKLDIVPLQVLIEATIAEVTLTDELKYGLQWFFKTGNLSFNLTEGTESGVAQSFASSTIPSAFSFLFSTTNIQAAINALEKVTDVNVISSPQLMVLDNQTATLQVGDQVPFATQSAVNLDNIDPNDPNTSTITTSNQLIDTGIILKVTPRVNKGGLVIMEIEQEVSDAIGTTSSGIDSPTIQQRKITSTIAIQSGETVALGGLIKDKKDNSKSGLPVLSQVPVLGALFGTTSNTDTRTELLILITPRVVRNLHEARAVTDELRKRLRAVIPLGKKIQ
jgi:general secretion pathway protein D